MNVWLRTRWPQYQALAQYLLHVRNETLFESLKKYIYFIPTALLVILIYLFYRPAQPSWDTRDSSEVQQHCTGSVEAFRHNGSLHILSGEASRGSVFAIIL